MPTTPITPTTPTTPTTSPKSPLPAVKAPSVIATRLTRPVVKKDTLQKSRAGQTGKPQTAGLVPQAVATKNADGKVADGKAATSRPTRQRSANGPVQTAPDGPKRLKPATPATASATSSATTSKTDKPKKAKLVRDSFTIPKLEYLVLDELKLRANKLMNPAKKSEILRAGIKALAAMPDAALLAALKHVPAIKTGRPTGKATKS